MLKTADDYFQTHDLMDFKLQSTVGFDDEDLQAIADMEHIAEIMPSYSADVILQQENKNATVKVMGIQPDDSSYTELNKPVVVIEGRMPQAANECVVDHSQAVNESITIGSTVQFAPHCRRTTAFRNTKPRYLYSGRYCGVSYVYYSRPWTKARLETVPFIAFS